VAPLSAPQTLEEAIAIILAQAEMIAQLQQRVQELEARLAQNSSNSSRPPSSDPPGTPPPARNKAPSGRKRGGQPGHDKRERSLVPPEQVDRFRVIKPEQCECCNKRLDSRHDQPWPERHQVFEVPPVKATVDEYQLYARCCDRCGSTTRAALPAGVPRGQFGPRLQAIIAMCSGAYRLAKRSTQQLLHDFFGVDICLGTIANLEQATGEVLAEPVREVAQAIQQQTVVHADETGWYERSRRAWLWMAATAQMAVFLISPSRGTAVAQQLLGAAFAGWLVSDRWSAYNFVDVVRRQLCWSHLDRDFKAFAEQGTQAKALSVKLGSLVDTMFHHWHRVRDGTLTRIEFHRLMEPIQAEVELCLQQGTGIASIARKCRNILKLKSALWTFVRVEGVDPTNNRAERTIRHPVLWRKTSLGTDSPAGSRFVERILTTVVTLRLQKRNVLDYITKACSCALYGNLPPSLLPKLSSELHLAAAA
jgi:transposase